MNRYKSFFVLCLSLFLSSNVFADSALVSRFVFVTGEQSVRPGQLSTEMTVQTQNTAGEAEKVSETQDMTFSSSSATGEFVNASGNSVTTTMSKNTSSRTFYYRDTTSGTHTLTVSVVGRDTGKTLRATQEIVVSSSASASSGSSQTSSSVPATKSVSAHSSQEQTSELKKAETFKVDAGRKRITTIHTPIEFNAESSALDDKKTKSRFEWSFGDGTSGRGKTIEHIYQFAGDYVVVLNSRRSDTSAVARTEVRVVDPKVEIVEVVSGVGGYVELNNPMDEEVNVGKWFIKFGNTNFVIAPDTIILPQRTLRIPLNIEGDEQDVSLYFPSGVAVSQNDNSLKPVFLGQGSAEERTDMLRELVRLKRQIADRVQPEESLVSSVTQVEMAPQELDIPSDVAQKTTSTSPFRERSPLVEVFEEQQKDRQKGIVPFFKSLFSW